MICLDPENEYEEITRRLGGAYLDLTSGKNLINVLERVGKSFGPSAARSVVSVMFHRW